MARGNLKAVDQIAMDERIVQDEALEQALEKRLRSGDDVKEARKVFKVADVVVKERVAVLEVAVGEAVRCGRFRITRNAVPAKSVSFETDETSRLSIKLWDGE